MTYTAYSHAVQMVFAVSAIHENMGLPDSGPMVERKFRHLVL